MSKRAERGREPLLVPTGIARRPEENCSLVVINPVNVPPDAIEVCSHFTANKSRGAGNQ
jgi:hypothetical protein